MIRSLVVLGISILALLASGCSVLPKKQSPSTKLHENNVLTQPERSEVCFEKKCRSVERADDPSEQKQGLMKRTHMEENAGMLFIFPKIAAWPFWMKDTLIPLDMIWLDDTGKVVYVHRDVQPCPPEQGDSCPAYGPKGPLARYVLELNAGQAEKYGLSLGTVISITQ